MILGDSWLVPVLGHSGSWLVLCNFSAVFLEYKQCARAGGGGGDKKEICSQFALYKHNLKGLFLEMDLAFDEIYGQF